MNDKDCIQFLQWALPQLQMRWPGFRKVRRQVCKRISRRMEALQLRNVAAYCSFLEDNEAEWLVLDGMCRVTISRFYRDRSVYEVLSNKVLPELIQQAEEIGDKIIRFWSAGCASGEEPYTLAMIWDYVIKDKTSNEFSIVATDADNVMIERAKNGCYSPSSIKNLPEEWLKNGFTKKGSSYYIKPELKKHVRFVHQDIRDAAPEGKYNLILCRNLVFTYFSEELQKEVLKRIESRLYPGGALVIGIHENLPEGSATLTDWFAKEKIYRKPTDG